ncbi:MAG TPA: response regulator transcription factor [Pyrinomonadaceae bacterium]|nr:response regulator transcription factor [Pyrinomonadaceae bacterium]
MVTLLIVEDNRAMRNLIRSIVADVATDISECSDGSEALSAYRRCRPDWVLMDIGMPQMDGIAATNQIKAAFPEAKVVIVTDHDNDKLRNAASVAGACAYVLKEDLLVLREVLTQKQTKQAKVP